MRFLPATALLAALDVSAAAALDNSVRAPAPGAKMVLPPGCSEADQKYLELFPNGPYSADSNGLLTAAGLQLKTRKK